MYNKYMQYRTDKYGNKISALGFGCMRFSRDGARINFEKAEKEILKAFELGVNYYDTAYIYPGSEALIGEIFEKINIRNDLYIATKLPHYMIKKESDPEKFFSEELKRLRTDHVDYYLMHMLTDINTWERLKALGIIEWLDKKKKQGAIKQVGFSYHGNSDAFIKLVDAYDWDFTQIQYNYLDETSQAGRAGLMHAASKGIPVIIMEPLRGGKLVNDIPEESLNVMKSVHDWSPAEWGLKWLYDQPEVTCVLSGMNSVEMVEENVRIADSTDTHSLSEEDFKAYGKIIAGINAKIKVGCTGCRYCMPCPKNVDILGTFAAYNRRYSDGFVTALREYYMCTTLRKDYTGASNCIECGKCEQHCPQNIAIRKELKNAKRVLENPIYKIAKTFAPLIMKY